MTSPEQYQTIISEHVTQAREDREYIINLQALDQEGYDYELEKYTSSLLAELDDIGTIQQRYEQLYASLSISSEPYDETRQITLEDVDLFVARLAITASSQLEPSKCTTVVNTLLSARHNGLNPNKKSNPNPLETLMFDFGLRVIRLPSEALTIAQ